MSRQRAASRRSSTAPRSSEYSGQSKVARKATRRRAAASGPEPNHSWSSPGFSPVEAEASKTDLYTPLTYSKPAGANGFKLIKEQERYMGG